MMRNEPAKRLLAESLQQLYDQYHAARGSAAMDDYLLSLAFDAALDRKTGDSLRRAQRNDNFRRKALRNLEKRLGYKPAADDIVQALAKFVPVPPQVIDAIRHDIVQLLVK